MDSLMNNLVALLHDANHSLVVYNNGFTSAYDGRGVSDLFRIVTTSPDALSGALIADKVVGKGAAALMIIGGAKRLHTDVISQSALDLLSRSQTEVSYDKLVPYIINRQGTGMCPVETLCRDCHTAQECLPLITSFVDKMKQTNKSK